MYLNEQLVTCFKFGLLFSKVMYLNEQQTESTRSLSDRIDLATKFKTYAEKFASENYQVTHNLLIFGGFGEFYLSVFYFALF